MFSSGHQWKFNGLLGFANNDSSFLLLLVFLTGSKPSYIFLRNCEVFSCSVTKIFLIWDKKPQQMLYTLLSNSRANIQDKIVKVIMYVKPSKLSSSEDSTQSHSSSFLLQFHACATLTYSQQAAKTISSYKAKIQDVMCSQLHYRGNFLFCYSSRVKPSSQLEWISHGLQKELYLLMPKLPMARDITDVREAIVTMNQKTQGNLSWMHWAGRDSVGKFLKWNIKPAKS